MKEEGRDKEDVNDADNEELEDDDDEVYTDGEDNDFDDQDARDDDVSVIDRAILGGTRHFCLTDDRKEI